MAGSATGTAQGIGDSSVAEFTLSCMRFFATLRMTRSEGLPQNDKKQRVQGFGAKVPRNDTKSRNIVNYLVKDVLPATSTKGPHHQ